ncbi:heme-dependent oxidative N-demethylase subunit alpha family protein [Mangrovicoccus ximenensis]|uniref:heme-dependent oxidative N-demethylase subunit alpha family protein n=1 Tax=Mangrovicoccus ximenensis TaxID=1911570 RepID=UPI000D3B9AF9|nr:heme-dependent oxidative N-demethylase subunit alpha family protein [Mangrovicoccus ximenensis]
MAERERLIREVPELVTGMVPGADAAAAELLDTVLAELAGHPDFRVGAAEVACPDGRMVAIDRAEPMATAGRLVQEDLCLMQRPEGAEEHLLAAAVLCFPANWTLAEKLGRPMLRIHAPVAQYGDGVAKRVQRLLDGVQPRRVPDVHPAGSAGPGAPASGWCRARRSRSPGGARPAVRRDLAGGGRSPAAMDLSK